MVAKPKLLTDLMYPANGFSKLLMSMTSKSLEFKFY